MKKVRYTKYCFCLLLQFLAVLGTVSCSREAGGVHPGIYNGERIVMKLRLGTRAASQADEDISAVRAIVFDDKGQLVYNGVSQAVPTGGVYSVTIEAARGFNDFFIICNETEDLGKKLAGVTLESEVENVAFSAAGIGTPLPMYGKVAGAYVAANSDGSDAKVTMDNVTYDYLSVKVDRMVAAIGFTVIKNIPTGETDFTVTGLRIRVCRMPASTTVGAGRYYTSALWADDLTVIASGTLDNNGSYAVTGDVYTVGPGVDKIVVPDIYIPEHLLEEPADASHATYLKIDAQCRLKDGSQQTVNSIYLLNLGEAPPQNHNLERNNHYSIYATITGLGAMGLYAEIVAMKQHDITVNWKPIEGMVIVSDKAADYDFVSGNSGNVNVWNDYTVYSGILKAYHSDTGYRDVLFKYGSVIAVWNDTESLAGKAFVPPADASNLNDIVWYPASYGNPADRIASWSDIPYIAAGDIPADNSRAAEGLGDPCKLAGLSETQIRDEGIVDNGQWHMATPQEYAVLIAAADKEAAAGYNDYGYRSFHTLLLPNVKFRDAGGLLSADTGGSGHYWTTAGLSAFGFSGADPAAAGVAVQEPGRGYTVRCVRNDIPESYMMIQKSPTFSYKGNTDTGVPFSVASNVPYGTATLITGDGAGTATDFDDFSFEPGDTHVHTVTGGYSQDIPVYVKRRESRTERTFKIKVEGMGFDGLTVSQIVTVKQTGYSLRGNIGGFTDQKIPKAGKTYSLTVTVTPNDIAVPAGTLRIEARYLDKVVGKTADFTTAPGTYVYPMEITIAPNETPDVIGLLFNVYYTNPAGSTTTIGYNVTILQDKV